MDASGNGDSPELDGLNTLCESALERAEQLFAAARHSVGGMVVVDGRAKGALVEKHQTAVHGLAWVATYIEGLRQMLDWGRRLEQEGRFDELERLMVQAAYGEYLNQLAGGIALSQVEIVRPGDMGLEDRKSVV